MKEEMYHSEGNHQLVNHPVGRCFTDIHQKRTEKVQVQRIRKLSFFHLILHEHKHHWTGEKGKNPAIWPSKQR